MYRIVISLKKNKKLKKISFKKRFKAVKLDTKDFKFDRNEANKR